LHLQEGIAFSGAWRLDALPRFGTPDGRFLGYAGRLRRAPVSEQGSASHDSAADTMRQVLHELRTPANAIQIAAEIIQQQLYGHVPHEYRALAAAIAGDTAQILAGFEELDRLVKLEAGVLVPAAGECDFSALVWETVERLRAWTRPRGGGFSMQADAPPLRAAIDRDDVLLLVWRLLAALASATAPGDVLDLNLAEQDGRPVLTIELPSPMTERLEQARASGQPVEAARSLPAGMFGIGFTLRLAGAEARAAGGALERQDGRFRLILPGLTPTAAAHTQV